MRTNHTFTVVARVPEPLMPLAELTRNLGWLFDHRVIELFRHVDRDAIEIAGLDPLGVLNRTTAERLAELADDATFVQRATDLRDTLASETAERRWPGEEELPRVAYFSPEFGLAASVPQYSGGLGVLAGDHLKAAADLGVPITGVGLFYRSGYFRQVIDEASRQAERFPWQHPAELALEQVEDLRVSVPIDGQEVEASIWKARVGANDLLLLDTQVPTEESPDQLVNDRLYGGGSEERIRQELLLGVGGRRALKALGIEPEVYHLNEGHAGFLTLELIREAMETGMNFEESVEYVRGSMLFTTHTPVPAGIDRFPLDMIRHHFKWWTDATGVSMETLLALGSEPEGDSEVFNLAHMSLRLCGDANGVAALHGRVSRNMFKSLWPGVPEDEVPIGSVTNGVHAPTFMTHKIRELLEQHVGDDWRIAEPDRFRAVHEVGDQELWDHRNACRTDLVRFVRHRAQRRYRDQGGAPELLDAKTLTIGFARRFATYKRGALLLTDPERLHRLLSGERSIQLVFAGKAHPADEPGKEIVHRIAELANDPELRLKVVFVEDYDLDAGRQLTRGVDVWLNTPIRPMEACGTSGMKGALNGVLNVSVLDGWWDEGYRPDLGWAIPTADHILDPAERDRIEAEALYDLLERNVIPAFYDRDARGVPTGWTSRMATCLEHLVPAFTATRMVREYVTEHYIPAAEHSRALRQNDAEAAKSLAGWRAWVTREWPAVQITSVSPPYDAHPLEEGDFKAGVQLGELHPNDVVVEYVLGAVDIDGRIADDEFVAMEHISDDGGGNHTYRAPIVCEAPGTMGVAVRVRPHHPSARRWTEAGLVRWAD